MARKESNTFRWSIFLLIFSISAFCRSENAMECSNTCSEEDSDLHCWNGTENFLLNQLVAAINNLTKVEFMIDKWRSAHDQNVPINEAVADLVQRVDAMNKGPLDPPTMDIIVNYTVTQILTWASWKSNNSDVPYVIRCPVPDDYINTLWIYMFSCACIVMVLMLVFVVIHVHKLNAGNKKRKRLI